jgi:hypothetical protein
MSGIKVLVNGGINSSVRDGWWDEPVADKGSFLRSAPRVLKSGCVLSIVEHQPDRDWEPAAALVEPQGFARIQQLVGVGRTL